MRVIGAGSVIFASYALLPGIDVYSWIELERRREHRDALVVYLFVYM